VIGREVEDRLLHRIEELARDAGLPAIECTFIPTARNGVAVGFLPARGWSGTTSGADEAIRYRKELM
jgi:predicted enzyme involved in methoxymalonyl-ACP biosynthesis